MILAMCSFQKLVDQRVKRRFEATTKDFPVDEDDLMIWIAVDHPRCSPSAHWPQHECVCYCRCDLSCPRMHTFQSLTNTNAQALPNAEPLMR